MSNILTWGYEAPVKGDFIKNKEEIRYKIKKMEKEYVSENHDNFRKPEYSPEKGIYLFDYTDEEGQEKWRKKLYEMVVEDEKE
mmetsp:Transcript_14261/g.13832  ORF Transcript_14261/g.13832 Transcript_14261/m.13832 type:complete len:83 (+) Transcript_14261:169-417(+)